jgi:hypothetical protein
VAEYIPKINLPLEGVEHARWLERRSLKDRTDIDELFRLVRMLGQANATSARATTSTAVPAVGVPVPSLTGGVIRGRGGMVPPIWTHEWQGLMPEYWVTLSASGGSYYTSGLGLSTVEADDEELSRKLLPPVQFGDGGLTMLPIDASNYTDDSWGFSSKGQTPIHLYVELMPSFNGEEFTIYPPTMDNSLGVTSPFYTFDLSNQTEFSAVVHIENTALFYEGTLEPVLGDVASWNLEAGFIGAWFVRNVKGWGAIAAPVVYWDGMTASFSDPYYEANVYTP